MKIHKSIVRNKKVVITCCLLFLLTFITLFLITYGQKLYEHHLYKEVLQYTPDGVLTYGADDSAPPLRFIDSADGQYKGCCVDYINLIALEMGIKIASKPLNWCDALDAVKKGEITMCDMFANEERGKDLVFTDPLFSLRTILVCCNQNEYTLSDISKLTIATQREDWANYYLKKHYPDSNQFYVHDVGEGLDLLLQGKVDAVIGDEPVVQYYASKKSIDDKIHAINTALYEEPVVLGISKKHEALLKPLNHAISQVKKDGSLEKVQQRWFGISTSMIQATPEPMKIIKYIIFTVLLATSIITLKFWENRSLKKKVTLRTKELEASKNELGIMINELPESIIVLNNEKKIKNMNSSAAELVRCKYVDKFIGKPFSCYLKMLKFQDINENELFNVYNNDSFRVQRNNSFYEYRNFPIRSNLGSDVEWMVTIKDITLDEIKRSDLLQSSKMIAIGQLAAGMAHQLRNPLGIIRTQSYLLRKKIPSDESVEKSLDYIEHNVMRASTIVDNVMNFWRIGDNKNTNVNIKEFLSDILYMNDNEIKKKSIKITLQCKEDIVLFTNQESIKHIFMNILQNAIEAIESQYGHISITVQINKEKSLCIATISDNGIGISKDNITNLYNPFFTTKAPGQGTGLGLYIVYNEIKNLKGTIDVKSIYGEGTIFTITIPINHKQK